METLVGYGSFVFFIGFVYAFAFAAATSSVMSAKGCGFTFWWALAGLFFGPVALLAAIGQPDRVFGKRELQRCGSCLSAVPVDASVCRYCTRPLATLAVTGAGSVATVKASAERSDEMSVAHLGPDRIYGCACGMVQSRVDGDHYVFPPPHSMTSCA